MEATDPRAGKTMGVSTLQVGQKDGDRVHKQQHNSGTLHPKERDLD